MYLKVYRNLQPLSSTLHFALKDQVILHVVIETMFVSSFILMFPLVCYSCFVLMAQISLIVGAVLKL